jgi:RNA-binding protein YhbY
MVKKPEILTINIGKNGLTETVISEIKDIIRKYKTAKVKFLPSAPEREDIKLALEKIANSCKVKITKKVGFIAVLKIE